MIDFKEKAMSFFGYKIPVEYDAITKLTKFLEEAHAEGVSEGLKQGREEQRKRDAELCQKMIDDDRSPTDRKVGASFLKEEILSSKGE